jgi:pentapeptide MXKDX repeat protein
VVASSLSSISVKNPRCHKFCAVQAAHREDPCFVYNLSHSHPCDPLLFRRCNKRRLRSKFWGDIVVKPQRALPGDYHVMIKRTALILSVATLSFELALAPAAFAEDAMKKDTMSKDAMSKDSMSRDSMKKDSMSKDSMSKDAMSKDAMSRDSMSKDGTKKDDTTKN